MDETAIYAEEADELPEDLVSDSSSMHVGAAQIKRKPPPSLSTSVINKVSEFASRLAEAIDPPKNPVIHKPSLTQKLTEKVSEMVEAFNSPRTPNQDKKRREEDVEEGRAKSPVESYVPASELVKRGLRPPTEQPNKFQQVPIVRPL